MIRCGKDAPAALFLPPQSLLLQKSQQRQIGKPIERTVQELGIADDLVEKIPNIRRIGKIPTSLSRDIELFAKFFILLDQPDRVTGIRRGNGGHHACGAAADYNDASHD